MVDVPVTFPPGFGRLATNPYPTGSPTDHIRMGIVAVACRRTRVAGGTERDDDLRIGLQDLRGELGEALVATFR